MEDTAGWQPNPPGDTRKHGQLRAEQRRNGAAMRLRRTAGRVVVDSGVSSAIQKQNGCSIDQRLESGVSDLTFWCPKNYFDFESTGILAGKPKLKSAFQCPVCTRISLSSFVELSFGNRVEIRYNIWQALWSVHIKCPGKRRDATLLDTADKSVPVPLTLVTKIP